MSICRSLRKLPGPRNLVRWDAWAAPMLSQRRTDVVARQHSEVRTATPNRTASVGELPRLRLFRTPPQQYSDRGNQAKTNPSNNPEAPVVTSSTTLLFGMPPVGGNYDFVIPPEWPATVFHIDHNVFSASRPYPVVNDLDGTDLICRCYKRCVADNGTTATSSCENVATYTVCDDSSCLIGPACGNRFVPRYNLELIETRAGFGVMCSALIPKGAFVIEYVGDVIYAEDAAVRINKRYQAQLKTKTSWGGGAGIDIFIDALRCGNESRFINHSCQPNCELYEWNWTNSTRRGIFAARDIPPLQELTFDYHGRSNIMFDCACGFPNCTSLHS